MKAQRERLDVVRWEKTGDGAAMRSGVIVCDGWTEARKVAQRWMLRGSEFFVSIMPHVPPFSERRGKYAPEWDWYCATGGEMKAECFDAHGSIDAPLSLAAGSVISGSVLGMFGRSARRGVE